MANDLIYYCDICAMAHSLPLRVGEFAAGFCRLCGEGGVYVGYITADEAQERGIVLPPMADFIPETKEEEYEEE